MLDATETKMPKVNNSKPGWRRVMMVLLLGGTGLALGGSAVMSDQRCIVYTYDGVGNRTTMATGATTSELWGTGVWGCFDWTAP